LKLDLLKAVRTLTVSAGAVCAGLFIMRKTTGRREETVRLDPCDVAPDFELPGSDGRTYRLGDFRGARAVVLAWFPKAFTGG
jgi:hypothetical protein